MILDTINLYTQKLNESEKRFEQMNKNSLTEFVQMYMEFSSTYAVAKKIFCNLSGTQDQNLDNLLKGKAISVPSKEEILLHREEALLFTRKVQTFADKIEIVANAHRQGKGTLIPVFAENEIKERTASKTQDNEGISFMKPGFLDTKKK